MSIFAQLIDVIQTSINTLTSYIFTGYPHWYSMRYPIQNTSIANTTQSNILDIIHKEVDFGNISNLGINSNSDTDTESDTDSVITVIIHD